MKKEITIHSPATVANMVCGFDILGFAINDPFDIMVMRTTAKRGISIINKDDFKLPVEPEKNAAGGALLALLEQVPEEIGFEIEITKHIKPGSGIGSSAASAAGAVVGANYLLNNKFTKNELISFAMCGEQVASGTKHADNVAPCIYGGITLVRNSKTIDVISIPAPELFVTIVHPLIEVKTSDARSILKTQIQLKDAVYQWANIAGLVAGLMKKDFGLIGRSLEDIIVEPLRSILIPGFSEIKQSSIVAGALGGGISGSGPSVFMLSASRNAALAVESVVSAIYTRLGIDFNTYVTTINFDGIKIFENK